jgi:sialate O-acetylesterase
LLKTGRNVVTVRVLDMGSRGGWRSDPAELQVVFGEGDETVSLSGSWKKKIGAALSPENAVYLRGIQKHRSPSMLYNAMLHPLLPQPIKGVIWYQGESNNGQAEEYEDLFAAMIEDWRARWNCGEFPFLYVQIAPYKNMTPELREAQRRVLGRVPNTAMAVTTDVGDAEDIHPAEKEPVGRRLALAARALAYGEDIEYSGPLYRSMAVEGNAAVIRFTHTGSGLVSVGGALQGFEIAGSDGIFVPAEAEIDGDTVVVSSDQVKEPAAVRYGWSNVPDVNLFNRDGLPASPFTTEAM